MSGRMPASSQASSELSTASFTVVRSALRGLSNPSRWRFFAKNSATEMSRCFVAISSAVLVSACALLGLRRRVFLRGPGPSRRLRSLACRGLGAPVVISLRSHDRKHGLPCPADAWLPRQPPLGNRGPAARQKPRDTITTGRRSRRVARRSRAARRANGPRRIRGRRPPDEPAAFEHEDFDPVPLGIHDPVFARRRGGRRSRACGRCRAWDRSPRESRSPDREARRSRASERSRICDFPTKRMSGWTTTSSARITSQGANRRTPEAPRDDEVTKPLPGD